MERLDFASVIAVLRRNISEDRCPNQVELVYALFRDFCEEQPDMEFDNGQICRWINGLARLSPRITAYYQENRNRRKLANTIESHILPMMPDSAMAVQELHDLLIQAPNVPAQKKAELTEPADPAVFVTEIPCFAMELHFEKRDVRKPALIPAGSRSPAVADFIFSADVPRPCRWFQGRESELEQLHLLMTERKVFLHGIPGIGKSELAKVYNTQHGREYTNVLYLNYTGSLTRDIAELDFADDLPGESEDIRFRRHDRFLRSLREDTLLIVDNFNAIASQDTYLDAMLQYRCRILFTTRCRFEDQISLELTELPLASLLGLMKYFYPDSGTVEEEIIELLHRHTFAVELAARLLACGMLSPKKLRNKIRKEKAAMDATDNIRTAKDGTSRKATYYTHIHTLFSLNRLRYSRKKIMRGMALMPAAGVSIRRFGEWIKLPNLNDIHTLIEMGLIHPRNPREIQLHPMIQEVAMEAMKPSVQNCSVLLYNLETIGLIHGWEFADYQHAVDAMLSVMNTIIRDNMPRFLLFLENIYPFMEKYQHSLAMDAVMRELEQILSDGSVGTAKDRALLMNCKAARTQDTQEAIRLNENAISLLGEITGKNAHLAANLYSDLGGLYFRVKDYNTAKAHMEHAMKLMNQFGLALYHDSITQMCNYASLLIETRKPHEAYAHLLRTEEILRTQDAAFTLDYALVHHLMADACIITREHDQAVHHFRTALAIYENLLQDEPELLEEKRKQINENAQWLRISSQGLVTL